MPEEIKISPTIFPNCISKSLHLLPHRSFSCASPEISFVARPSLVLHSLTLLRSSSFFFIGFPIIFYELFQKLCDFNQTLLFHFKCLTCLNKVVIRFQQSCSFGGYIFCHTFINHHCVNPFAKTSSRFRSFFDYLRSKSIQSSIRLNLINNLLGDVVLVEVNEFVKKFWITQEFLLCNFPVIVYFPALPSRIWDFFWLQAKHNTNRFHC
mmetsp:Transcript_25850/g.41809  ORF Transcript_25850/g.41809 Transcript_25850/m.41809 type:complete len:209 (-) Transcript_25850:131-757(-)